MFVCLLAFGLVLTGLLTVNIACVCLGSSISNSTLANFVRPNFSGLYALWRPYWLDSDDPEDAKKITNPKQVLKGEPIVGEVTSEDSFLMRKMREKHKVVFLPDVGAVDFGSSATGSRSPVWQYIDGSKESSLFIALFKAFLYAKPFYLMGYLDANT